MTIEHTAMLFRRFLSFKSYSNQGFEALHRLQRQVYTRATNHDAKSPGQSCKYSGWINVHHFRLYPEFELNHYFHYFQWKTFWCIITLRSYFSFVCVSMRHLIAMIKVYKLQLLFKIQKCKNALSIITVVIIDICSLNF